MLRAIVLVALFALPAAAAEPSPVNADAFFDTSKIWDIRLKVSAEEWKAMQPSGGRRGPGGPPGMEKGGRRELDKAEPQEKAAPIDPNRPRSVNAINGTTYPYARASVEIAGITVADVGLRYK